MIRGFDACGADRVGALPPALPGLPRHILTTKIGGLA